MKKEITFTSYICVQSDDPHWLTQSLLDNFFLLLLYFEDIRDVNSYCLIFQ